MSNGCRWLVGVSAASLLVIACPALSGAANVSTKKLLIKDNADAAKRQVGVLSKDTGVHFSPTGLVTTDTIIREHEPIVRRFTRAWIDGIRRHWAEQPIHRSSAGASRQAGPRTRLHHEARPDGGLRAQPGEATAVY